MKITANTYYNQASQKLKEANEEYNRPEEDIVSYGVCENSRFAVENYLKGYLVEHNIDPKSFDTVNSLYAQCKLLNSRFEEIDLTEFGCDSNTFDTDHCNEKEIEKVNNCYEAADKLDTFLRQEKII